MSLTERFVRRVKNQGLKSALNEIVRFLFGISLINLYNSIRFREHRISTSCDIEIRLPPGTKLPHPVGIVIGHEVVLGSNVKIRQNVTLGRKRSESSMGYPVIGDDVTISAGAVMLGNITIGSQAVIGANSVVLNDVDPGMAVAGAPAAEI